MAEIDEVLHYLNENKEATATKISEDLKIHYYKIQSIIKQLLESKQIKVSTQKRHHTYYSHNKPGGDQ